MKTRTIVEYVLAGLVVLILGGLSGWYFFLRSESQTTTAQSNARGLGSHIPVGAGAGQVALPAQSAAQKLPQLWHVHQKPVAGLAFVGYGSAAKLRYVERSSGYVFEADPATAATVRLTNTLMPKIYEAHITESGHIYERSLDDAGNITTFVGTISTSSESSADATTSTRALLGLYLQKNIVHMAIDPKSDGLFYLTSGETGVIGVRSLWNGSKQKNAFSSIITNWRPTWLADGRTILAQAAGSGMPGYAYALKDDGTLAPLLRDILGLTIAANGSGALLYGESSGSTLDLFTQTGPNATAVHLPIQTVADKCAWMPGKSLTAYCGVPQSVATGNFLDNWYRGATHPSDAIWRVDASSANAELVFTPETGTPLDIVDPTIDSSGNYLAFINGADESLWLLRLNK